jgi:hypothetical protein
MVSIPLKQVDGHATYQLRLDLGEAAQNVSNVEQHSTTAALLGYLDEKARADEDLSEEHMQNLRYRHDGVSSEARAEGTEHCESVKCAELMGRRLRDIGDEYMWQIYRDPQLSSYVDSMVNESGEKSAAQNAFEHFCEVVNIVLQCDESGAVQISIGRVAALFSYCYHLCKVYITRKGIMGVVGFLGQLLSYLIRCLYRSRFYTWLSSQGGWVQLVKQTYHLVPTFSNSPSFITPVIVGSVLLLGLMAYKFLT